MSRDIAPFGLRMSSELKSKLEESAKENGRSLNAELVHRLEESLKTKFKPDSTEVIRDNGFTRYKTSGSTYKAAKVIKEYIRYIEKIDEVIFAVRDDILGLNKGALTLLIKSDDEIALFDTSQLTAVRRPREMEIYDICNALDGVGAFHNACFVSHRIDLTHEMKPSEASQYIESQEKLMMASKNIYLFLTLFSRTEENPEIFPATIWLEEWPWLCGLEAPDTVFI